jgi:hypothetical protein
LRTGERAAASGRSSAQPEKRLRAKACIVLLETDEMDNPGVQGYVFALLGGDERAHGDARNVRNPVACIDPCDEPQI